MIQCWVHERSRSKTPSKIKKYSNDNNTWLIVNKPRTLQAQYVQQCFILATDTRHIWTLQTLYDVITENRLAPSSKTGDQKEISWFQNHFWVAFHFNFCISWPSFSSFGIIQTPDTVYLQFILLFSSYLIYLPFFPLCFEMFSLFSHNLLLLIFSKILKREAVANLMLL